MSALRVVLIAVSTWLLTACVPTGAEAPVSSADSTAPAHVHEASVEPAPHLPPPLTGPRLSASVFSAGRPATLTARGMPPGARVYFLLSLRGTGRFCPSVVQPDCVGLAGPVSLLRSAVADRTGMVAIDLSVPTSATGTTIALQAVSLDTRGNTLSNTLTLTVQPFLTAYESCRASDLRFAWPMGGTDGDDWVIVNYVDLSDTASILDYRGGDKSYDGHEGIDIVVPSFREMDNGTPVLAAAPGEVIEVREDQFDRNIECVGSSNYVRIHHANGFDAWYKHFRRDSIFVEVGDQVVQGQELGVVGSSGCSTQAHLHFEVHDCDGEVLEPFLQGMWNFPPVYDTPISIMDGTLRMSALPDPGVDGRDPYDNLAAIGEGDGLILGVAVAGGGPGDTISWELRSPLGAVQATGSETYSDVWRINYLSWARIVGTQHGTWRVNVFANGVLDWTNTFQVWGTGSAQSREQRVHWDMSAGGYQAVLTAEVAAGYRPVWVDVSTYEDTAFYNAIFEKDDGTPWVAWHDANTTTHGNNVQAWTNAGYRMVHTDGASTSAGMRYVGIFEDTSGDWSTHYGQSTSNYGSALVGEVLAGRRPVNVAMSLSPSGTRVASLFDDTNAGAWSSAYDMDNAAYGTEFANQEALGRFPSYIDAYNDGTQRYSAVWDSRLLSYGIAIHNVSEGSTRGHLGRSLVDGMRVQAITANQSGFNKRYAYIMSNR